MNKGEFIDYMAEQQKCTKAEAERIINAFSDTVTSALSKGKEITLIGFGKFYSTKVAARQGRNPKTGQPVKIEAYVQPKFSAGKKLKDACNGKKTVSAKTDKKKK